MSEAPHPVVVLGAGLSGACAALALARGGLETLLVGCGPGLPAGSSGAAGRRPIALSESSRRILSTLGVWPRLAAVAEPIERILVSEHGAFARTRLGAADLGMQSFGHVLEAGDIATALDQALAEQGVERLSVQRCSATRHTAAERLLDLAGDDGRCQRLAARLVVAADGGGSALRGLAGIGERRRTYQQQAITAWVRPRQPLARTAFERFTAEGPVALLPLRGGLAGLVWCCSPARAEQLWALGDEGFAAALQRQLGNRPGGFSAVGPRARFDLEQVIATRLVAPRLVLVGNAASQLHPVAGQGFNLALRDVAALAEHLRPVPGRARQPGSDPGDAARLQRYASARQADRRRVLGATDGLVRAFSTDLAPLACARRAGLLALTLLPGARRHFARLAMGLGGRHSRLLRGLAS